jgi:hypothetical protein
MLPKHEPEKRFVEPIGIKFFYEHGQFYMQAFDVQYRTFVNFAVKSILRFL